MLPMLSHRPHPTPTLIAMVCAAALSTGCSSISDTLSGGKVDYRSNGSKTVNLEVPPDLVQLNGSGRYSHASGEAVSASTYTQSTQIKQQQTSQVALNAAGNITLEREGQLRWLKVNQSPDAIWANVRDFWAEQGFELTVDQAENGLLETSWSENRAKLKEDALRNLIGSALDKLYDTGERDKYRTRIERTATGSEIYISHLGLVEVYTDSRKEQTTWKARPADPELEVIMLSKLMTKLGASKEAAAGAAAAVTTQEATPPRAKLLADGKSIALPGNFDQAWRRVSLALDRGGFTVEDRNRSEGTFDVRLAASQGATETGGFLSTVSSWFGGKQTKNELLRYRMQLNSAGNDSVITVQGDDASGVQSVARLLAINLE
jgi:outer membrane protein assembly factor BamC